MKMITYSIKLVKPCFDTAHLSFYDSIQYPRTLPVNHHISMTTQKEEHMRSMGAYVAEFIGTFTLILAGAGSIIVTHDMGGVAALIAIAFAHGFAIAVMASALGAVSGGHFNPAVTLAMLLGGHMKLMRAASYMIAQLTGAVAGGLALAYLFFPTAWHAAQLGTPMLAANVSGLQGMFIEAILTFFLVIVIHGTAVDTRAPKVGALFIGLTITMDILLGGPLTGAAMNPARTFGPALVGWLAGASYNPWTGHLVYWFGPILGALAAQVVYAKYWSE